MLREFFDSIAGTPPAAPSFPPCRKRWGRKGALGSVWCRIQSAQKFAAFESLQVLLLKGGALPRQCVTEKSRGRQSRRPLQADNLAARSAVRAGCGAADGRGAVMGKQAAFPGRPASSDAGGGGRHVLHLLLRISSVGGPPVLRARAAPRGAYGAAGRCPGVCRTRPAGRAALSFERAGRGGGNGDLSVAFDGPCAQAKRKGRSLKTRRAPSLRPMPPGGRLLMRAFPFCPCPDRLPECSCC